MDHLLKTGSQGPYWEPTLVSGQAKGREYWWKGKRDVGGNCMEANIGGWQANSLGDGSTVVEGLMEIL